MSGHTLLQQHQHRIGSQLNCAGDVPPIEHNKAVVCPWAHVWKASPFSVRFAWINPGGKLLDDDPPLHTLAVECFLSVKEAKRIHTPMARSVVPRLA